MKISKHSCTGCGVCSLICPKDCIKMQLDKLGMLIPEVSSTQCIHCGSCIAQCPQNNPVEFHEPLGCYAAWSKHITDYVYSASGGVAAEIARFQIKYNSVIYGCDYDKNGDLFHFRVTKETDIPRLQSSKYSQSTAYTCYQMIKKDLLSNISVVFIGTPCQVAGLLRYLKADHSNLITVDLVCHGTPPNTYLKNYLLSLGIDSPYDRIRFRGEFDQQLTIWKNGRIVYQKDKSTDPYFAAFYKNMISYNACYTCQYATSKRVADITIGDFWGLKDLRSIRKMSNRPSLIMTNTAKGQQYFNALASQLIFEERDLIEGITGNGRLMAPPGKNRSAKLFQKFYRVCSGDFLSTVKCVNRIEFFISHLFRSINYPRKIYSLGIRLLKKIYKLLCFKEVK